MERLTFKNGDDCWCVDNDNCFEEQSEHYCGSAIDRLAAYEDIELTPEEIVATLMNYISFLSEMTGGRMSKTNYTVEAMVSVANDHFQSICDECREDKHATELLDAEAEGRLVVLPCKVGDVIYGIRQKKTILPMVTKWFETNECGWTVGAKHAPMAPKFYLFDDFGKTVFLTREEAEAALKGEQG